MMKKMLQMLFVMVMSLGLMAAAFADAVYPYTNPTYVPTAVSPPATYSAPADYVLTANGLGTVSMRISGTCTSLAGTLQGTNDSTTWTDITLYPVGGGASVKSYSAAGFWRADTAGFSKVRAHITALTASCTVAMAGTQGPAFRQPTDPCADPAITKSSAVVAQGASTTAALVAAVTGKVVYMCSFAASAVGTNPTLTLKTGTQASTACDTAAANLTGAIIPAAANGMINIGTGHTVTSGITSGQLCMTTGATTSIQGVLTYVQQ